MKAKKQWLSLFGAVAMSAALMLSGAKEVKAASASVVKANISDVTAEVGDEISIPITFSCDNGELKGCNGVLKGNYDTSVLEYVKAEYVGMPSGMTSIAGGNFGYVSGETFKSGTINLKFKVLKCTAEPTKVSVTGLTFSNAEYVTTELETLTATVTIEHVKANYKTDEKAATCTEAGYKKVTCGDCGAVISDEVIKAEGHDKGKWTVVKAATCTEAGSKELHCTKCGTLLDTATIEAEGHDKGKWTVVKEATCKEEGSKELNCTKCGTLLDTAEVALTDHTWDEGKVQKEATCKEEGEKLLTCTVCGTTKLAPIAKTAHIWKTDKDTDKDGWKVVTAATKEKEGSKERECTVCGEKETAVIAKLSAAGTGTTGNKSNATTGKTNSSSGTKTTTTTGSAKTGDNAMSMEYLVLFLVAVCGIGAVVAVKRRRVNH